MRKVKIIESTEWLFFSTSEETREGHDVEPSTERKKKPPYRIQMNVRKIWREIPYALQCKQHITSIYLELQMPKLPRLQLFTHCGRQIPLTRGSISPYAYNIIISSGQINDMTDFLFAAINGKTFGIWPPFLPFFHRLQRYRARVKLNTAM